MTLKQANKQGYRIKKGAKSVLLEKWVWSKIVEEENENGELEKKIVKLKNPYVNFFRVFNAEQIDGIGPIPKVIPMEKNEMLKLAEEVIASSQCEIVESMQNRSYYSPKEDKIMLPPRDYFKSQEAFLAVTLHEVTFYRASGSFKPAVSQQIWNTGICERRIKCRIWQCLFTDGLRN